MMKLRAALLACAAFACTATALAAPPAERRDTITPGIPTQLPRTAIPRHYAISFTPNAAALTFTGKVSIDLDVVQATRTLVLNAADIAIASASLKPAEGAALAGSVALDAEAQTATITFPSELATGRYRLDLDYSGKINRQANGLFALDYKDVDAKDARALFTQFEAPDARRFVPSFDEPDYKATFDLTARVPSAQLAVSNMPVEQSRDVGGGFKEVRFATSPEMSTYLLFFGLGELERITKQVGNREVGIVMPRGQADQARFALDAEAQVLPYFDDYFGTPYPLPKLDNIAGPGQSQFFGAMENWGAIFTFSRILLVDPTITSEIDRQRIFTVQAHEMAHQWFGDLVTMAWWDDLWLNEGFASWMASRATQHFYPEWGADVGRVSSREEAMTLDSFATTHPIVQQVRTVEQVNQAFDAITYEKGETVIAMLEGFAGEDVWRAGIRDYMKRHAYQNTRTSDLWSAVERAGAKGLVKVAADFTTQPGIPLIKVGETRCEGGRTIVPLSQSEFSNDRREQSLAKPLTWSVPVRASAGGEQAIAITEARAATLNVPGCGPLLINPGQSGYYRTLYTNAQAAALRTAFPSIGPVDQFGLLNDALALSRAGYQPMARALDLLAAVPPQGHQMVVEEAIESWHGLYEQVEGDSAAREKIRARVMRDFAPRLAQLGFVPREGEPALDSVLRTRLIAVLGQFAEPGVLRESERLFAAWQANRDAIPGSLKETWLTVIARNATPATWEALHKMAQSTQGTVERTTLYQLLGSAKDKALARRALELALTEEPGPTVSPGMLTAVAVSHPELALDFAIANLKRVNELVDLSARSRFVPGLATTSSEPATITKLTRFAEANIKASDRKPVERAITTIRWRSANAPRIKAQTAAWVRAH